MKRVFVFCRRNWLWVPIAIVVLINVKLHTGPNLHDAASVGADVHAQLLYLRDEMHEDRLAERMQGLFPEGYLFAHVLYGLTWCEWAMGDDLDTAQHAAALREARYAFSKIDSDEGRSTFEAGMRPPYGMYYQGWRNYLLAKIVQASHGSHLAEVQYFGQMSRAVAACFENNASPYPDSYPDHSWPADACVGMASLALYNRLVAPTYAPQVAHWVKHVRATAGGKLLPHKTHSQSTRIVEGPRGCSSVLNLYFLPEIDAELAVMQFDRMAEFFGQSRLGLATVREYPSTSGGRGDVDSGPVILGVGFAATIVGIGAYLRFGEVENAQAISDAVEALGFSYGWTGKRYIGGMLPIADLFIAWARMQRPDAAVVAIRPPQGLRHGSNLLFHGISLAIVLGLMALRYRSRLFPSKPKPLAVATHDDDGHRPQSFPRADGEYY